MEEAEVASEVGDVVAAGSSEMGVCADSGDDACKGCRRGRSKLARGGRGGVLAGDGASRRMLLCWSSGRFEDEEDAADALPPGGPDDDDGNDIVPRMWIDVDECEVCVEW